MLEATPENIIAVLKEQIAPTQQNLDAAGYAPTQVREQVSDLAQFYGNPILDVGTGAYACLATLMAQYGLSVTEVDHVSSAVRIAQERVAGQRSLRLIAVNARILKTTII